MQNCIALLFEWPTWLSLPFCSEHSTQHTQIRVVLTHTSTCIDSCNLMYDRFCILCLRHSLHFISFISILLASELLCRVWSPPHFSSFQYYTVYSYICFYICCCIVFVIVWIQCAISLMVMCLHVQPHRNIWIHRSKYMRGDVCVHSYIGTYEFVYSFAPLWRWVCISIIYR